jgi:hypothetical protein
VKYEDKNTGIHEGARRRAPVTAVKGDLLNPY